MDQFGEFVRHLDEQEIASSSSLAGCTVEEVAALEGRYGIRLPACYRKYLEAMGHGSGRLFTHDHMAVVYSDILEMTDRERGILLEEQADLELPPDALIIAGRLGEQFQFIRCNDPHDSPVWYYAEWDLEPKQVFGSVLEWLHAFAADARDAIESGYFGKYPQGTSP